MTLSPIIRVKWRRKAYFSALSVRMGAEDDNKDEKW